MKRITTLLLATALMLPFSCTKPDNQSDLGTEQNGKENNGKEDGNGTDPEIRTYKPGDYYKAGLAEGIVAEVDESGTTGLLISLDEGIEVWSTSYTGLIDQGYPFSHEDGSINIRYIKEIEGWKELYPAFAWCDGKNVLGLSAWYLPAIFELETVCAELEAINAGLEAAGAKPLSTGVYDYYWSSTEGGAIIAYSFSFHTGAMSDYDNDKKKEHRVRAMRKF